MKKLLYTENDISWLPPDTIVETYFSDEEFSTELCPSAYAIVFKDGALLQTDLREGERPKRTLDIPGGHCDPGELPVECAIRETFEETGVRVNMPKPVGYKKIIHTGPMPEGWQYPYPTGYMAYYLCQIAEETEFVGNNEVHGRVWLKPNEFEKSPWYLAEKGLVDEIVKEYEV